MHDHQSVTSTGLKLLPIGRSFTLIHTVPSDAMRCRMAFKHPPWTTTHRKTSENSYDAHLIDPAPAVCKVGWDADRQLSNGLGKHAA